MRLRTAVTLLLLATAPVAAQTTPDVIPTCKVGEKLKLTTTKLLAVTWRVSTASPQYVLTVDSTGMVDCLAPGTAIVWAVGADGKRGIENVRVFPAPTPPPVPTVSSVALTPASATMLTGATQQFAAVVTMSDGSQPPQAAWSATGGSISAAGLFTAGLSPGQYAVIASAGNLADTSQVIVNALPPDTTTPPPPTGNALFRSEWSTATGNSDSAVRENGKWDQSWCGHSDVLSVVPGSAVGWTLTPNVLQVTNRGETRCWQIENTRSVPTGRSYYIRFYAMVDNENQTNFHPVAINVGDGVTPTQMSPWSIESPTSSGWQVAHRYSRLPYNDYGWKATPALQRRTWYRFEYHLELLAGSRFRVWPRVYNMQGQLIIDARNYNHLDGGARTLQQFHDNGGSSPYHSLDALRRFGVGYEGSAGASASNGRWYYAAFEVRSDTWVGPRQ